MRNRGARAQLVAVAAALLVFVVVQVASAGPSGQSAHSSALRAKVKRLNRQVSQLAKDVAALKANQAPPPVTLVGIGNVVNAGSCSGVPTGHWYNVDPSGSTLAGFYRDRQGRVFLQGTVIRCGGAPNAIFNMPPGFRPAAQAYFIADGLPNSFEVAVGGATGAVAPLGMASGATVSLDGISFRCSPSGSDGCP